MSGLEKIVGQIEEEAKLSADQIIRKAEETAAETTRKAKDDCSRIRQEADTSCKTLADDVLRKSLSAAKMQKSRRILAAKQQAISDALDDAARQIRALEPDAYFGLIEKMLAAHALPQDGSVRFNETDLARLPEGFEATIAETAKKNGGSLTLDRTPCGIDGGFVLYYGGVEENCSFTAVFAQRKEALQDKLHTLLFGGGQ